MHIRITCIVVRLKKFICYNINIERSIQSKMAIYIYIKEERDKSFKKKKKRKEKKEIKKCLEQFMQFFNFGKD